MASRSTLIVFSLLEMLDKLLIFIDLHGASEEQETTKKLFTIQNINGKGQGMIAEQNIKAFTVILLDKPLLTEPNNITTSLEQELYQQFINNLSKSQQSLILNLSCDNSENNANISQKIKAIYDTNSVGTTDSTEHKSGLFPTFSRVNHSCLPNCCMYYEGTPTNCIILKSLFPIKKYEEISIGYIPRLLHTYKERKELLQNSYGFECQCIEMCRFETKYDKLIVEYRECIKNTKDLESIQRAMHILNKHFNGYPSMMTHFYNICADICMNHKLYEQAISFIEKSIVVHLNVYGIYKRDRWKLIRRKIVLMKYRNNFDSKYDRLLTQYNCMFNVQSEL